LRTRRSNFEGTSIASTKQDEIFLVVNVWRASGGEREGFEILSQWKNTSRRGCQRKTGQLSSVDCCKR
jgi:hypothetical protein